MSEKIEATSTSTETGSGGIAGAGVGASGLKAIIKNVDMSEEMQQESVDVASGALEKYNIEKDIAAQIKKEFDKRHGATWHVVVGKNFGSYVTHGTSFDSMPCKNRNKPRLLVVQKRSISSTFTSALSLFSSGSHSLTDEPLDRQK
jgi:dynein light chain LC8-type